MAPSIVPRDAAVLYLRMSSAKQDKSIPAQRDELLAYAAKHGYHVHREYVDSAISGDDTARRTEFLRMRDDAAKGGFAVVLCWDQDRFGRFDPIEGGYWILPFRDAGVRLETIAQGKIDWTDFAGRLLYVVQQEAKHAYLRDLSRNVARGTLAASRKDDKFGTGGGGPSPFGYVTLRDGTVEVDPHRAAIVRRIFEEYAKPGASLRSVADGLNRDGITTRRGTPWKQNGVRRILTNRKYTGAFVRFRYTSGKYHAIQAGEIVPRNKTDKQVEVVPLVVVAGNHEPIVDQELFDQVQRKLARQQKHTARRDGYRYLLGGLIVCGDCGRVMRGSPARHGHKHAYVCGTYHAGGRSACFHNYASEDRLVEVVVRMIRDRYVSDQAIARLRKAIERQQAADREPVSPVDQRQLRKRIEALDQKIDQGASRVFEAPAAIVPKLYVKLGQLRQERDELQRQLAVAGRSETRSAAKRDHEVEAALDALRRLRETFDTAERGDLRELISTVVSKINLEFSHDTSGKQTRNTITGGTIWVRPEPGLGSLMFPNANDWASGNTHKSASAAIPASPPQSVQTPRSPRPFRTTASGPHHGSARGTTSLPEQLWQILAYRESSSGTYPCQ
jgi:DNA invertase Pin-like site-specific DNA recombinase